MLIPANLLGILFGLTSGIVWGSGDFTGGYATRRISQYHVLAVSGLSGLVVIVAAAAISRESFPSAEGILWSILGGLSGALGLAVFYPALAMGCSATVAPTTAIVGAGLPVVFSVFTEGLPAPTKLVGFAFAFVGIGLVSRGPTAAGGLSGSVNRRAVLLGCLSGVGFAGWFICMGQVEAGKVFTPLIFARFLTFLTGLLLVLLYRQPVPSLTASPLALLTGVLDAGGNLFYILSKEFTRLDIAAVLASLGPAVTVLLAGIILKEKISQLQGVGVAGCLVAIELITV